MSEKLEIRKEKKDLISNFYFLAVKNLVLEVPVMERPWKFQ
jgi:hypothetical protein